MSVMRMQKRMEAPPGDWSAADACNNVLRGGWSGHLGASVHVFFSKIGM